MQQSFHHGGAGPPGTGGVPQPPAPGPMAAVADKGHGAERPATLDQVGHGAEGPAILPRASVVAGLQVGNRNLGGWRPPEPPEAVG